MNISKLTLKLITTSLTCAALFSTNAYSYSHTSNANVNTLQTNEKVSFTTTHSNMHANISLGTILFCESLEKCLEELKPESSNEPKRKPSSKKPKANA
ncbi:hypothetical protein [Flocculibacter collagenilyticus]|uniref:hypothetical protein n=1 Tax=Flocculibacter collagenilyticus TaxID=2744479 RepID=UPI0018F4BAD1|nr:hypothetical protein [Flocculibacter collagenilyticus]